jgi:hypothetical protein
MTNFHKFLAEHAKFPFPLPVELQPVSPTNISIFEVGILKEDWKAKYALRDDDLIQKLCHTLRNTLGDAILEAGDQDYLLRSFSPQFDLPGHEDNDWLTNSGKAHVSFSKDIKLLFTSS